MSGLTFLDTETVTLEPGPDVIWEIGLIVRDGIAGHPDEEWRWQIRPNMSRAHPKALEVSMFNDRFEVPDGAEAIQWAPGLDGRPCYAGVVAANVAELLDGRHVVGAVPNFDTERIRLFLIEQRTPAALCAPWHYHLVDVEALAVGYLHGRAVNEGATDLPLPWRSDDLSRACGVEPPGDADRHTALGDARWCRDLYDAITGRTQPGSVTTPTGVRG